MTKQDYETLGALMSQQLMLLGNLSKTCAEITDNLNVAESLSRRDVIDYSTVAAIGFAIDMELEMVKISLDIVHSCAPKGSDDK